MQSVNTQYAEQVQCSHQPLLVGKITNLTYLHSPSVCEQSGRWFGSGGASTVDPSVYFLQVARSQDPFACGSPMGRRKLSPCVLF